MATFKDLLQTISKDYREGRLELPSLPEVAFKVRAALQDEDKNISHLGKIMQADPALAARLIQVVNSPRYMSSSQIDTCRGAIARLGLDTTRNLAISLSLRGEFNSTHPQIKKYMQGAWQQSCKIAAISFVLAGVIPGLKSERALLAGLLCNIGSLPFFRYLEQFPELIADDVDTLGLVVRYQGRLGSLLLERWKFEPDLVKLPMLINNWSYDSGDLVDYIDVVLVARAHSLFGHEGTGSMPSLQDMPAFKKLPISHFGPGGSLELLTEANEEVDVMMKILR